MATIRLRRNLWGGILSVAFGLTLLIILIPNQVELSKYILETVDSRFVPELISYLFCILGLALIFQSLIQKNDTIVELSIRTEIYILLYLLILVAYVFLIKYIGFFFSCLMMGIATLAFLKTKKISNYIATLSTFVLVYFAFIWFLKVPLPTVIGQYL